MFNHHLTYDKIFERSTFAPPPLQNQPQSDPPEPSNTKPVTNSSKAADKSDHLLVVRVDNIKRSPICALRLDGVVDEYAGCLDL